MFKVLIFSILAAGAAHAQNCNTDLDPVVPSSIIGCTEVGGTMNHKLFFSFDQLSCGGQGPATVFRTSVEVSSDEKNGQQWNFLANFPRIAPGTSQLNGQVFMVNDVNGAQVLSPSARTPHASLVDARFLLQASPTIDLATMTVRGTGMIRLTFANGGGSTFSCH